MPKKMIAGLGLIVLAVYVYGCSSSKVHVRSYIDTKKRVDQDISGNAGYLYGPPDPEALKKSSKSTRQVFVVEVERQKKDEEIGGQSSSKKGSVKVSSSSLIEETSMQAGEVPSYQPRVNIPKIESIEDNTAFGQGLQSSYVEYKVEKDDTLQKVAKKFYNSYSKWPRIYEANRDVIKSPDHIKPGIVLKIPQP